VKLNAAIIKEELAKAYKLEMTGPQAPGLHLGRPVFYMDGEDEFAANGLYLATVEHLPKRPRIRQNAVLVCIGDGLVLNYYRERLCLITIKEKADFFRVYQRIQAIFDRYEDWEQGLYQDVLKEVEISRLIRDSEAVFRLPLYVLDRFFRFIAASGTADPGWMKAESSVLNPESLEKYLADADLMLEKKEAFLLEMGGKNVVCANLFDRGGNYQGCLCVDVGAEAPRGGLIELTERLAGFLNQAIQRNPQVLGEASVTMKSVMRTLVEEQPLSRAERVILRASDNLTPYLCLYMKSHEKHRQLPLSYICDLFEENFRESYAFPEGDAIIAFYNVTEKQADFKLRFHRQMKSFCSQMRLCAGISNEFRELFDIRLHYLQAQSALEDGLLLNAEDNLFYFSSYALTEMVINSLGGLPVEAYFPEGFTALLEHDEKSPVSYLETLRVFLEENLSFSAAAQKLYIHRSTLLDRIDRIEREMGIDIKNPEQRLLLEILLRAMDLEEIMRRE